MDRHRASDTETVSSTVNIAHVFDKSGPHHGRREKERISYGEEVASLSSQYNSEGTIFLIVCDPIVFDLHK